MSQQPPGWPGKPEPGPDNQGEPPRYPLEPPAGPTQPPGPWQVQSPWRQPSPAFDTPRIEEPQVPTRSPRQPFGNPPPQAVHIESFAPPKQRWTIWVGIGAVVLVALVVLFTVVPLGPGPVASPTRTLRTASTPQANVVEFSSEYERSTGRWEVVRSEWGAGYVDVEMKIDLSTGDLGFSFYAFGNTQSRGVESTFTDRSPDISTGRLSAGESIRGWVRFPLSTRETSTVILATSTGRQIAALPITG